MEQRFWEDRWAAGQIAFHNATANPRLVAHAASLGTAGRVLVPLCGKSLDMTFLAALGFEVVGVEFVQAAAQAYFAEAGVEPMAVKRDGIVGYQHENVTIWVADILAVSTQLLGAVDAIYDRAALVALPETSRSGYAKKLVSFAHQATQLLLITFEHDLGTGPPFSIAADEVQKLLGADFDLHAVQRVSTLAESPRWKERGATRLEEVVWVGPRR